MCTLLFRIVKNLQSAGVMITQVACGARHSLALTTGECFISYIVFFHQTENVLMKEKTRCKVRVLNWEHSYVRWWLHCTYLTTRENSESFCIKLRFKVTSCNTSGLYSNPYCFIPWPLRVMDHAPTRNRLLLVALISSVVL